MGVPKAKRLLVEGAKSRCINCKAPIVYSEGSWIHPDLKNIFCNPEKPGLTAKPERTFHPVE